MLSGLPLVLCYWGLPLSLPSELPLPLCYRGSPYHDAMGTSRTTMLLGASVAAMQTGLPIMASLHPDMPLLLCRILVHVWHTLFEWFLGLEREDELCSTVPMGMVL